MAVHMLCQLIGNDVRRRPRIRDGTDRLIDALNQKGDGTPYDILMEVRHSVNEFVKDAEQFDDLTMMCVEYRGTGS